MDNVQKRNICTNAPSSQIFRENYIRQNRREEIEKMRKRKKEE
jgi:hypothetical protein